ncbi:MAG TPA: response regulator [Tepidisphaeraceae bacterium]|nr:response regulator [Tepidisphaeraceae bacterium]
MRRILIVDDDADLAEALRKYLERDGYTVECAYDGTEALESILKYPPDLIILDLLMPRLDGSSLLEILRSYLRFHTLRVIVLSALIDGPTLSKARNLKVAAALIKGKATLEEIAQAVRRELGRPDVDSAS